MELAETRDFPSGSPVRAYLLRLPLHADGRIDIDEMNRRPRDATVRRYWPNEPDQLGVMVKADTGWHFCYRHTGTEAIAQFHVDGVAISLSNMVRVTDSSGECLPFRVLRCDG